MSGLFKTKTTKTEADKIAEFQVNAATYGNVVPVILGTTRISGNIIDYYNFTTIKSTETTTTGKGGKSKTKTVTYTYKAAVLIGLCEGPIDGIGTVWVDTDTVTTLSNAGLTLFNGAYGQAVWSYTTSKEPTHALPYSGLAYVAGYVDLDSSAGVKTYNFELMGQLRSTGDGTDCNPADATLYIMSNSYNGIGISTGSVDATTLDNFRTFCRASDMYITLPLTDTAVAYEIINSLCEALNTIVFWSQNKLKFVPRCDETVTGNGVTYTPNTTPVYDLDKDDFLPDDDGRLVTFERTLNSDTYNQATVEFINRANSYETESVYYDILSDINKRGLKPMSSKSYHFFHTKARAERAAQIAATESCFGRNTYKFKLGWSHALLEPGDIVTLTDEALDIYKLPVIIETFEEGEDEDGFEVEAKALNAGTYSPAKYETYEADRASVDYQVDPGNVNQPVIFEPADALAGGLIVWIGASGGENWGGCNIYVSTDRSTYKNIGAITEASRQGLLSSSLASGNDPDTVNTLPIDMSMSRSKINSGTQDDADNYNTLCYVDGELVSYETATLTDTYKYDLTYLRRGAYDTTVKAHNANTQFMRIDSDALFSYGFTEDRIGSTIYLKFASYNVFGIAEQDLSDVEDYQYTLQGAALYSDLPDCENLTSYYQNNRIWLKCDSVTDFRAIVYEWRMGASWKAATILGTTSDPVFQTVGDGTYWVSAKSSSAYSANPVGVEIEGSNIAENVIATHDEFATGWTGSLSGGASINEYADQPCINLVGSGLFSTIPLVSNLTSVLYYGGIADSGTYEIPAEHVIDIGVAQYCNIAISYSARISSPFDLFSKIQQVSKVVSFIGNYSQYGSVVVQVAIAGNDETFGDWQSYIPGQYYGRKFKARAVLTSTDNTVSAYLLGFVFSVDVPDRTDTGTSISVPIEGITITHDTPFHAIPNTQITILSALENDDAILTSETVNGFTVQIVNSGSGVARSINWLRKGY